MAPRLTVIDSLDGVLKLHEYVKNTDEFIAYDCETTGLGTKDRIIGFSVCANETEAFYVILEKWNKETAQLEPMPYLLEARDIIVSLSEKQLIMHNGVFDCKMAAAYFKVRMIDNLHTDTMILAHLLNENRRVGLKELTTTIFGEDSTDEQAEMKASVVSNGGKLTKLHYEMYKCDSYIMGKYGAKDALLTLKLFLHLLPDLYAQELDKFFYEDESMPLLRGPTYDLNTTGLQVDQTALLTLKKTLEAECLAAKDFIYSEIRPYIKDKYPGTTKKNVFSIESPQQMAWLLFGKMEQEFSTLTDAGREICKSMGMRLPYTFAAKRHFIAECETRLGSVYESSVKTYAKNVKAKKVRSPWAYIACDKKTLTKLAPKFKWVDRLLEYKRKQKILNTYVEGIESRVQYGIIAPSFLQHGTTSGRYSSRDPNFQNLPRDDKRVKSCIVARPGKIFVGADYSQLEPRVFAYFSGDERLLKAFDGKSDFYSVIGMEVFGKTDCTPQKDGSPEAFGVKYKRLRDLSKVIALASTYGATAHQLAPTTGKSIEDTQEDINEYFERFPGVREMMLRAHETAKTTGRVINLFGRPRRMPEAKRITKLYGDLPHDELPYEVRNMLNLAVNHTIQSTGASIINRAAIKFHENCKTLELNCRIVVQVHDSLVVECDEFEAETVAVLLQDAMETTVELPGVILEAVPKVGKNLAEV